MKQQFSSTQSISSTKCRLQCELYCSVPDHLQTINYPTKEKRQIFRLTDSHRLSESDQVAEEPRVVVLLRFEQQPDDLGEDVRIVVRRQVRDWEPRVDLDGPKRIGWRQKLGDLDIGSM